jgi:trehalose-phosphatase
MVVISKALFDAVIFDLDGVITQTAAIHAAAWKALFDDYLEERKRQQLPAYEPFDPILDYQEFVDGKPRYDGIESFLSARKIVIEHGNRDDPPEASTICGLANRKNILFQEHLEREGVRVYASTIRLIRELRAHGFKIAVISASENASAVLHAADAESLSDTLVDGLESRRLKLKGKPEPDVFLEAARRLEVEPARAVVVEDARAGVDAGVRGGFGLVIGVDRAGKPGPLKARGAHVVVADLAEVELREDTAPAHRSTADLPSALDAVDKILAKREGALAVFLDYDGTLTPIVSHPEDAVIGSSMRSLVRRLAKVARVAVISGRDLADVRERVGLDEIVYAGSHGFDIAGPGGLRREHPEAKNCTTALAAAETGLRERLEGIQGAGIERKKYSLAIHYRNVGEEAVAEVEAAVKEVVEAHPNLRVRQGKKVFDLQPDLDWHKGHAVLWLLETLHRGSPELLPIYLGDDLTDEDAFEVLRDRGVGIVVRDEPRLTAARFALNDTNEVATLLARLADASSSRNS